MFSYLVGLVCARSVSPSNPHLSLVAGLFRFLQITLLSKNARAPGGGRRATTAAKCTPLLLISSSSSSLEHTTASQPPPYPRMLLPRCSPLLLRRVRGGQHSSSSARRVVGKLNQAWRGGLRVWDPPNKAAVWLRVMVRRPRQRPRWVVAPGLWQATRSVVARALCCCLPKMQ